ncbi:MAG: NfeD family protein [Actinomycetales bacterium]|nr:NfeD family protein [Actinomycetales bacterium]
MSTATWLAVAGGALVLLEMLTLDFTLLMIALGLFSAAGALALSVPDAWAGVIGAAVSIASLGFLRPLALRVFRRGTGIRTGTDALLGSSGVALTDVAAAGQVKLRGEVWSARAYDGVPIAAGTKVDVIAIEGATAAVLAAAGEGSN